MAEIFPGFKVQKISVNAGFGCPNRDGTIGVGGCIYCNNASFSPGYCMEGEISDIRSQIERGKIFFSRKYSDMKYLVYFQSYTNTYTPPGKDIKGEKKIKLLESIYKEALSVPGVVGLVIGTRPDTFDIEVVELLGEINQETPVFVEFGVESTSDVTLQRINRGHKFEDTCKAVYNANSANLHVGLHLIAGLPGEEEEEIISNVREVCRLPIESIKLHHLQVICNTPLYSMWKRGEYPDGAEPKIFGIDDYMELCCRIVDIVPRNIAIERFLASAPPELVAAPKWGIKNYQFTHRLLNELRLRESNNKR